MRQPNGWCWRVRIGLLIPRGTVIHAVLVGRFVRMTRLTVALLAVAVMLTAAAGASETAEPTLRIEFEGQVRSFDAADLLDRPETHSISVPDDVAYHRDMQFRAIPLLTLFAGLPVEKADTIETRATDGFVSQLPMALILKARNGGSEPWVAIEDPAAPWPVMPNRDVGAGPFYLVWLEPGRSGVSREQWPYAVSSMVAVEPPVTRWPQIAVDSALAPDHPARRGQEVFIVQCLPCHRINGGGESTLGPDLAQPQSPTEYMTPAGLAGQIREPKSLRTWPGQLMPGFGEIALSNADLESVVAYLKHMAGRRKAEH